MIYVISTFENVLGIKIRDFDPGSAGAYMGVILAAYWGRRHTEAKTAQAAMQSKASPANKQPNNHDEEDMSE